MNQATKKFIQYLETERELIKKDINVMCSHYQSLKKIFKDKIYSIKELKDLQEEVEKLISFLKLEKEEVFDEKIIFFYYSFLSKYLEKCPLSAKEKVSVLMEVIAKNAFCFSDTSAIHIILDLNVLKEVYASEMNSVQFDNWIKTIDVLAIAEKKNKDLSKEELIIKKKIREAEKITIKKSNQIILMHKTIKRHYLDKSDSFTDKDILFVKVALSYLEVSPKIQALTIKCLKKELESRSVSERKSSCDSNLYYDYNALAKEINEVVDFENMFPKRFLRMEEIAYCLSLLIKMNVSKEQQNLFLKNCEMLQGREHPIVQYLDNYEKLKYYEESVGLQKEIGYLEDYFQESMLCSEEDYLFWVDSLKEELKQIRHWIPKNYTYEEEQAKKILSK